MNSRLIHTTWQIIHLGDLGDSICRPKVFLKPSFNYTILLSEFKKGSQVQQNYG